MTTSVTDWKCCKHGGISGGNGHMVHADKWTHMFIKGVKYYMCEDCKAKKQESISNERAKTTYKTNLGITT